MISNVGTDNFKTFRDKVIIKAGTDVIKDISYKMDVEGCLGSVLKEGIAITVTVTVKCRCRCGSRTKS